MVRISEVLAVLICMALPPVSLFAQTPTAAPTDSSGDTRWCFRGHPKPQCDVFWLTEAGIGLRAAHNRYQSGPMGTWELGWMVNRGTTHAVGVAVFAQLGDAVSGFGFRPRVRFWLNPTTSLDIAPGLVVYGLSPAPGFSGHLGLNFGDYAALTAHLVALRPQAYETDQRAHVDLFLGARLGAVPGAVVGGGSLVLGGVVIIACLASGCFID